ncbi:MAG: 2,3-diaminopropionate biosynthesis protein SbnB, partial [Pseudogulbenkiania sp.]|nr:2,3-diaminopropionate biosynthesis protein SbnB [Pseudogulbenkiania sp.]
MEFELSIINGKTVSDIIRANRDECVDVVRDAYLAHS